MAVDYTTTALLSNIKRKLQIPSGDTKLTDTELLAIADEEMRSWVYPQLLRTGQDYAVSQLELPIVAATSRYNIPPTCNADTIVSVSIVLSTGTVIHLHRVPTLRIDAWGTNQGTTPREYAIQGEQIVLLPQPTDTTATIRVRFERTPGRLILPTASTVQVASGLVGSTFTADPTYTATFDTSDYITAFRNRPQFESAFGYAPVMSSNATTLVLGTPLWGSLDDTLLRTGSGQTYFDYLCKWNESPVVPLPEAWHPVMLYAASSAVAREYGDTGLADYLRQEIVDRVEKMIEYANNRVKLDAPIAFNRNGPLRVGIASTWGRWP